MAWGAALLYAAWKPWSFPGRFLVAPYGAKSRFLTVRRYWSGGLGAALVILGAIAIVFG